MKNLRGPIWLMLLVTSPAALAAVDELCRDGLSEDRQPEFTEAAFEDLTSVELTSTTPPKLRLDTNLTRLDSEHLTLPFTQELSVSYVYESAGANHAMGWFYYDELIARGYVDVNGTPNDSSDDTLVDRQSNGIADFHEDLYNLARDRYVGRNANRRCSNGVRTFTHNGTSLNEPELAKEGCWSTTFGTESLNDARPGLTGNSHNTRVVGRLVGDTSGNRYSDNGLFPRIPNLLEPSDPANGHEGLGRMVFLLADDDGDGSLWKDLAPVSDDSTTFNGVPDYDSSRYDADGRTRPVNPNPGISTYDRTVGLGTVEGKRELVFFIVVFYNVKHAPAASNVYPCLSYNAGGRCNLHLKTPITPFFSKTFLNLDQNPEAGVPAFWDPTVQVAAARDIGCSYDTQCNRSSPSSTWGRSCRVDLPDGTSQRFCGWLDQSTLDRLDTAAYQNLAMPHEAAGTVRPNNGLMPHVLVGAPTTDPYRWILGFEDLSGGGDRDFNDVVFMINRINGASLRSATVSSDISPTIAEDFTITKVRFTRDDDPFYEQREGACDDTPEPTIDYYIAVDCRLCSDGTCVDNPSPTWTPVVFPDTSPQTNTVELDMLTLGFTGSQLCWSVDLTSPNEFCRPTIDNVDVGYQAVRAGQYSSASVSPLANVLVYGTHEAPGKDLDPPPARRWYDGKVDFSLRGRLNMQSLYDPSAPETQAVTLEWEAGNELATITLADVASRRLFTMDGSGNRIALADEPVIDDKGTPGDPADDTWTSKVFPQSLCIDSVNKAGSRWIYDLTRDDVHGTPRFSVCDPRDLQMFFGWLYGYENHATAGTLRKRPWPMGPVNHSTPAVVGAPGYPAWFYNSRPLEQERFRTNFFDQLNDEDGYERPTVAYVGTGSGFLHGFAAGKHRADDDPCTEGPDYRGYFANSPTCDSPRDYGTGEELFAYLPRALLGDYISTYLQYQPGGFTPGASVDASPSIADVDLGVDGEDAWTILPSSGVPHPLQGAKTVLVSATGKTQDVVFALDITKPDQPGYPLPMWEFKLADPAVQAAFSDERNDDDTIAIPDTSGSRLSPPIVRVDFGDHGKKWVAVVGTEYVPNTNASGTVYLLDLSTGRPVSLDGVAHAGVITLDENEGISGEPVMIDANRDGDYETMYVGTTHGRVYRIGTRAFDEDSGAGRMFPRCKVADAQTYLVSEHSMPVSTAALQRLHSNIAVKLEALQTGTIARIFFGTGDNPDLVGDPQATNYYVLAFEDPDPLGEDACPAAPSPLWNAELHASQTVWGGVALTEEDVFAVTAVGEASDACNLSQTESGRFYSWKQTPNEDGDAVANVGSGTELGGHGTAAPVVHDEHLFVHTADNKVLMRGSGSFNNEPEAPPEQRARQILWQVRSDGSLPE